MSRTSLNTIALLNVTVSLAGFSAAFSTSPLVPVSYLAGTRRSPLPLFGACVASSLDLDCECDVKAYDKGTRAITKHTRKQKYVDRDRHSARLVLIACNISDFYFLHFIYQSACVEM